MGISVVEPVGGAMERVRVVLFSPFDIGKWFVLGFCAFLANLGEGGGGSVNWSGDWEEGVPRGGEFTGWVSANVGLVLLVGLGVMLLSLVVGAVVTWLSSRGTFMFLDGVVRNRGAVVEPWRAFRTLGNSLFVFRFALSAALAATVLSVAGVALLLAWPDLRAEEFGPGAVAALVVGVAGLLGASLVFGVLGALLDDFVAPAMYQFDMRVLEAWGLVRAEVLSDRLGTVVLYFVVKFGISIVVGIAVAGVTCATCCVAAIPYVGTVLLLPVFVFFRAYPLCFLGQIGPDWAFFEAEAPAVVGDAGGE